VEVAAGSERWAAVGLALAGIGREKVLLFCQPKVAPPNHRFLVFVTTALLR